ncbi:MAG TPA: hypothetical protein VFR52_00020, partial [Sphingomicrobium sp.]|nr:hypothetical protein [Sphingomicrobium sp.]
MMKTMFGLGPPRLLVVAHPEKANVAALPPSPWSTDLRSTRTLALDIGLPWRSEVRESSFVACVKRPFMLLGTSSGNEEDSMQRAGFALIAGAAAADHSDPVASAMSAAPASISQGATIVQAQ